MFLTSNKVWTFLKNNLGLILVIGFFTFQLAEPAMAASAASPIEGTLKWVADVLQGSIARSLAIIAFCFCGFMFFTGRMHWQLALSIVVGIGFVFGAATLVDTIQGSAK